MVQDFQRHLRFLLAGQAGKRIAPLCYYPALLWIDCNSHVTKPLSSNAIAPGGCFGAGLLSLLFPLLHMLNRFRAWREKGWQLTDARIYARTWQQWGGSVITHPDIVVGLSALAGMEPRYLAWPQGGEPVGAIATWGRFLALSRQALRHYRKKEVFDLGNAEVILPFAPETRIPLRFSMQYVSQCHEPGITTLRPQKESIALARAPEEYSKKFLYNQRRELRLFLEQGGVIRSILEFSPEEIAAHYVRLFTLRWGFAPRAQQTLPQVLRVLRPFMTGSVLQMNEQPIALQLLYRVESPNWISVEYINGGVDTTFQKWSPGSILSFLNTQAAWEEARAADKPLRFSFGRVDRDYKMRWCRAVPVFRI